MGFGTLHIDTFSHYLGGLSVGSVEAFAPGAADLVGLAGADVSALPGTLEWHREAEWTTAGIPITDDHRDLLETIAMELALDLPPWIEA